MTVEAIYKFAEKNNFGFPGRSGTDPLPLMLESQDLAMKKLVIEHRDNLKGDDLANLGLAHQSCNVRKNPRGKTLISRSDIWDKIGMSVRGIERVRVESASMMRNVVAKPKFRETVERLLKDGNEIERSELVLAASADSGVSETTGERYYRLLCAKGARTAILEEREETRDGLTIVWVRLKGKDL